MYVLYIEKYSLLAQTFLLCAQCNGVVAHIVKMHVEL